MKVSFTGHWTAKVIEPNGSYVDAPVASTDAGQRWAYVGDVYANDEMEEVVGVNTELCTRLDNGNVWQCQGTLTAPFGCEGQLSFAGPFSDQILEGEYTITGGSGAFQGATGHVASQFNYENGLSAYQAYHHTKRHVKDGQLYFHVVLRLLCTEFPIRSPCVPILLL
jgi:hypothetical protein